MEISLDSVGRAFLYLGVPFVLMVFYFQWRWARVCEKNIQILVAEEVGGGSYQLAPKTGSGVSLKNPIQISEEIRSMRFNSFSLTT